ncbi:hypothetical protein LWI29_038436 [Acer saccharum]|uniref:Uncharacterized protein n=1 Tax=Acer saccharum TaxID=4024 RepID=A0AA39RF70_ACESA|nr:hypothetical protein LWI29_038436 [Acer saccharum]
MAESDPDSTSTLPEKEVKAPNLIERAKEEIEAIVHHVKSSQNHYKETHGRRDDIDENTPIDEVKGPSFFERAKEEIEALVETIHHNNKSSDHVFPPKEERGFWSSIGRWLENACCPSRRKRD